MHMRRDQPLVDFASCGHDIDRERRKIGGGRIGLGLLGIACAGDDDRDGVRHQDPAKRKGRHAGAGWNELAHFLDGLQADLERLLHINRLLARMPEVAGDAEGWRPVEVMTISPSEPIEAIAAAYVDRLPRTVRALIAPLGGTEARGAAFASYLLFEPAFTQALLALGERDAAAQADELAACLYGVLPANDRRSEQAPPARQPDASQAA